jgi:hypothetical protein
VVDQSAKHVTRVGADVCDAHLAGEHLEDRAMARRDRLRPGLLTPRSVPATGALAGKYTVCNRWFACVPTSTAPNRLMSMCGYTDIRDTGISVPDQDTVYDWLIRHGVPWRVAWPQATMKGALGRQPGLDDASGRPSFRRTASSAFCTAGLGFSASERR